MKKFKYIAASVVATMALGGCGGSDSSSSNDTAQTGTFVDAPVAGLSYQTPSISGQTDSNGQFKYKAGEKVTFKLGDIEIGSVDGSTIVTPKNFGNDTVAANLAYILQNLDTDGDPTDDVIQLPSADVIEEALSQEGVTSLDLENNATVTTLVTGIKRHVETRLGVDLPDVDVDDAVHNMNTHLTQLPARFTYGDLIGKRYISVTCSEIIGCQKEGVVDFGADGVSYQDYSGESGRSSLVSRIDDKGIFVLRWEDEGGDGLDYNKIIELTSNQLRLCWAETQEEASSCVAPERGEYFISESDVDQFIANKESTLHFAPKTAVTNFSEIQNIELWNFSTWNNQPLHYYSKTIEDDGTITPTYNGNSLQASFSNGVIHITGTDDGETVDRRYKVYKYDLSGKTYDTYVFGNNGIFDADIPHADVTFPQGSTMYCHILYDECFVNTTAKDALASALNLD